MDLAQKRHEREIILVTKRLRDNYVLNEPGTREVDSEELVKKIREDVKGQGVLIQLVYYDSFGNSYIRISW